jgi:hypothetical protein
MRARRHRLPQTRPPRGAWLAFLAVALQVLLPFFIAVEIARADVPGPDAVICSALGSGAHHDGGTTNDHQSDGGCPICAAVAAGQSFTAPAPLAVPTPRVCDRVDLSVAPLRGIALLVSSPYQSRGPPTIA